MTRGSDPTLLPCSGLKLERKLRCFTMRCRAQNRCIQQLVRYVIGWPHLCRCQECGPCCLLLDAEQAMHSEVRATV
jgi:hypothetical protein